VTVYVVEWSNWAVSTVIEVTRSVETGKAHCQFREPEQLAWRHEGDQWRASPKAGEEYTISPWEVG